MPRVAILGGGVSGLSAALRLHDLARERGADLDVTVFEQAPQAGGCVQTLHRDGLTMELGPDSLLIDKPAASRLLQRLALQDHVVEMLPEFKGARIVHGGKLHRIPSEFRLFAPSSLPALLTSGIFSPLGIARAALEPFVPKRAGAGDETLASFVTRRLGHEVLNRLAQPLIGGIYSGDPARLSMQATLPQFLELEQRYGSLVRAMQAANGKRPAPRLVSLRDGLGTIVSQMKAELGERVRTRARAVHLERRDGAWTVAFEDGSSLQADAVICALPAYAAAELLRRNDDRLGALLERIRYNSIATVNLAYDNAALPRSSGFIVPYVEGRTITAATFTTQKYPHRAPPGTQLVRAFMGGALQPELLERSDEELAAAARREFAELAGLAQAPKRTVVTRWVRLLPEYGVGHVELVREIEQRAAAVGALALAGSAYHGVGIPDCVRTGEAGAESVFGYLLP